MYIYCERINTIGVSNKYSSIHLSLDKYNSYDLYNKLDTQFLNKYNL